MKSLVPRWAGQMITERTATVHDWTPGATERLSVLTGCQASLLNNYLPGLTRLGDRANLVRARNTMRKACPWCMLRRGVSTTVLIYLPPTTQLCRAHGIWLRGDSHYRISHLPEVLRAQQRHHRLAKRYPETVEQATMDTRRIIGLWQRQGWQPQLRRRWNDRLELLPLVECAKNQRFAPGQGDDERQSIVSYPEFVALLELLAAPSWQARRVRREASTPKVRAAIAEFYDEAAHRLAVGSLHDLPTLLEPRHEPLYRWFDRRGRVRTGRAPESVPADLQQGSSAAGH